MLITSSTLRSSRKTVSGSFHSRAGEGGAPPRFCLLTHLFVTPPKLEEDPPPREEDAQTLRSQRRIVESHSQCAAICSSSWSRARRAKPSKKGPPNGSCIKLLRSRSHRYSIPCSVVAHTEE